MTAPDATFDACLAAYREAQASTGGSLSDEAVVARIRAVIRADRQHGRGMKFEILAEDARGDSLVLAAAFESAMPGDGTDWSAIGATRAIGYRVFLMTEEQADVLGHAVYRVLRSCRSIYDAPTVDGSQR